jgi:hypothetical protein
LCAVIAIVACSAPGAAGPASANHCDVTDLIVVSRAAVRPFDGAPTVAGPSANPNAPACTVAHDQESVDTRVLAAGATELAVRYTNEAIVEHLTGVLDGLGFEQVPFILDRHVYDTTGTGDPNGIFVIYDMENFAAIPAGPLAQGMVTATLTMPDGAVLTVTYHTPGS